MFENDRPSMASFIFTTSNQAIVATNIGKGEHRRLKDLFSQHKELKQGNVLIGLFPFDPDESGIYWMPENVVRIPFALPTDFKTSDGNSEHKNILEIKACPDAEKYKTAVEEARCEIELGNLSKVVLSRSLSVRFSSPIDSVDVLNKLAASNSLCYNFHVPIFDHATDCQTSSFVGSSPELLVKKIGKKIISNPLAGTRKRSLGSAEDSRLADELMSSEKDRHEHVLVVQSIIECLQPFCKHVSTSQTKVISTSKLWHLSTTIEGELLDPLMSSLEIAYALHPTPAICGTPRKVAQNLIRRLEGTERNYFSGLVGWCDHEGNGIWAVTIRCALITQESAKLYAGAGIVEQSVAELEYLETGAKMETVLSALGVQLNKSDLVT